MKLKRTLLAVLLVGLLLAGGCARDGGQAGGDYEKLLDAKNPVTVTLWHYYVGENQQAIEAAVEQFNQTVGIEKGVLVTAVAKGSIAELETAVTNSAMGIINADPMPELFSSYPDKALEIDALEMVCDLDPYFTDDEKQAYVDGFLADGIFEGGRMLLVPIVKSTELTYVNATAWAEFAAGAGYVDEDLATWEGVYDTARAYYHWLDDATPDEPWDGKGLIGLDSVANYIIIGNRQLGVDVIDAEGRQAVLDETVMRRIFEVYYQGYGMGYFDAVGKFRSDDIKSGDLAAYVGSSSSAAYFPTWIERGNTQQPIDFLPLVYPTFQGGTATAIQQGAGMCVSNSTPGQQAGAVVFLKWFTAMEQNLGFAMTTGYLPVEKAAYESPEFEAALAKLSDGDQAQQNVAGVYQIALHQITEADTYAAKPFTGSYDVRSILQATLMEAGDMGRQKADALKAGDAGEDEILAALDVDAAFDAWLAAIRQALAGLNISVKG